VDETRRGVADVRISVDHVVPYDQHWWYRIKPRVARTRSDGSFRIGGLSFGPYTATLEHPAFGTEFVPNIPEDARDLEWGVESLGGVLGRMEGLAEAAFGRRVVLVLESADPDPGRARSQRIECALAADATFLAQGVRPGRYLAWVQTGSLASVPQAVDVTGLRVTSLAFALGGGGRLRLRVWDAAGRPVDPATVTLVSLRAEGEEERRLGRFVTRGGRLDAEGVAPGRYRAEVEAPGYLPARTEAFDLREGADWDAGDVELRRMGTLQILEVLDESGRPVGRTVRLSLQEGEGEVRALQLLRQSEVPVRPGRVTLRAEAEDGGVFEETVDVPDGETVGVTVRLRR
jgi:hypothetical protein